MNFDLLCFFCLFVLLSVFTLVFMGYFISVGLGARKFGREVFGLVLILFGFFLYSVFGFVVVFYSMVDLLFVFLVLIGLLFVFFLKVFYFMFSKNFVRLRDFVLGCCFLIGLVVGHLGVFFRYGFFEGLFFGGVLFGFCFYVFFLFRRILKELVLLGREVKE